MIRFEVPDASAALKVRLKDVPGCMLDDIDRLFVPASAVSLLEKPLNNGRTFSEIAWACFQGPIYAHQKVAAQTLATMGALLLCDEMGGGKTRSAWAGVLALVPREDARVLVVAPKFLETVWRTEVVDGVYIPSVFSSPHWSQFFVSATGIDIGKSEIMAEQGGKLAPGVYFIHYEILEAWQSRICRHRFDAVIFDEVHLVANPKSKRAKAALAVAETARVRMALTGTPLVNRPADLWVPLSLVHGAGSFGSLFDFRRRYCGTVEIDGYWQDTGPTNTDELQKRMAPTYLRRTLAEIAELSHLPPFGRERVDVDMDHDDLDEHQAVLVDRWMEISDALNGRGTKETLGIITRLRQQTSKAKLGATVAKVAQLLRSGESVVVFVTERKTAEQICTRLQTVGAGVRYVATGDSSAEERMASVTLFQETGGLLVATYAALGMGVTLHRAAFVVLHDLPWTFKDALQAESRIHRIGQLKPTRAFWMCAAPHTIDELVARVLLKKAEAIAAVGIGDALAAAEQLDLVGVGEEFVNIVVDDALSKYFERSF